MSELLIASNPTELVEAQNRLIASMNLKIDTALDEARSAHEMVEQLQSQRLSIATARQMHRRATSRVTFLMKIKAALEAGYVMMPDMTGDIIAVRTDRKEPSPQAKRYRKGGWKHSAISSVPDEQPAGLPAGEGHYVSPRQDVVTSKRTYKDNRDVEREEYTAHAIKLRDPDGLDRRFIRPQVISRTVAAMTTRIFDEIATIQPQVTRGRRSRDPIVLGRVVDHATKSTCAFLIAWFVDPETDI